ncbi:hypothetical protein [Kitasatospora sp. NPDC057500]|uniref:hypothetical protein n=1 Tax=Kitasatospora sp. NPDC057500 TaxID=3346151 RepID=UPI003690B8F1
MVEASGQVCGEDQALAPHFAVTGARPHRATGRADERVVVAVLESLRHQRGRFKGTVKGLMQLTRQVLDERPGAGAVQLSAQATFYRPVKTPAGPGPPGRPARTAIGSPGRPFTPGVSGRLDRSRIPALLSCGNSRTIEGGADVAVTGVRASRG